MLTLALRNVLRHRARTTMTLAAIAFGVAGLILSGGFVRDIFIQLGEALIHSQTGHLQVLRAGYIDAGSRAPEKYRLADAARLRGEIAALPEVAEVMSRIAFSGLLNNGRSDWAIVGEGVEPEPEARLGSHLRIIAGRQLSAGDANGILLGQGVAQALQQKPGDRVTLLINTADGALNTGDFDVVGVFQSFSKDYDARAVRIPLAAAQDLLATRDVNNLVVALKATADTAPVAQRLKETFAAAPVDVRTWVELNDFYEKTVALYDRQFGVLQLITLAMVLLSVANSVNMSVFERVGEFGTMRALGDRNRKVFRLVLAESLVLGLLGATLGVVVGTLLALAISAIGIPMPPPPNANLGYTAFIRIVPSLLAMSFAVGLAATTLAALLPAYKVSRTSLVDALRSNV
jgi:putative ABC transport system permease protein